MRLLKLILFFVVISIPILMQSCLTKPTGFNATASAPFLKMNTQKVDSLLATMTLNDKIGQMIWAVAPEPNSATWSSLKKYLKKEQIGCLLFDSWMEFDASDYDYDDWRDSLDVYSDLYLKEELLIGTLPVLSIFDDYEMMAIRRDSVFQKYTQNKFNLLKSKGIYLSFEPNVNSIIQQKGILQDSLFYTQMQQTLARNEFIIRHFQNEGVLTGLSNVAAFQGKDAPTNENRLASYQYLAQADLSLMLLDTSIFNAEKLKKLPDNAVRNYLVDNLHFGGLAVNYFTNKSNLTDQLRTGTDAFIVPLEHVDEALSTIKKAIENHVITEGLLDFSVKKILLAKEWIGKFEHKRDKKYEQNHIAEIIQNQHIKNVNSITILKDENNLIPSKGVKKENILVISPNHHNLDFWLTSALQEYANVEEYFFETSDIPTAFSSLEEKLLEKKNFDAYDKIIVLPNFTGDVEYLYGELSKIADQNNVILVHTQSPQHLHRLEAFKTIVYIPSNDIHMIHSVADAIYGSGMALGQFPINLSKAFYYGMREEQQEKLRLRKALYGGEVGCSDEILQRIDTIVWEGINGQAMPGCQVMVIKNGAIVYDKSFGYHTYDKKVAVKENHLYDLASVTKVISTTMAMMKLYQQGRYSLSDSLYQVLDLDSSATIAKVTVKELLVHQSGIQSFMPILRYLKNKDEYQYFSEQPKEDANDKAEVKIANDFYLYNKWLDTLWLEMTTLTLEDKSYRYSDVNANILQKIVEKITQQPLDKYVTETFYEPLGMARTLYNPLDKFSKKEIVPTEMDKRWRKQLIHGYVHDESAALLGGVGGNAGLFSTARDLAVVLQMLLNGGEYGGEQFLQKETIDLFKASTHGNYRGLGFNKQCVQGTAACSQFAPLSTFGHTGFTGNCIWMDPENELIYIFLSNRVYPTRNGRLSQMKIRERIHDAVYQSFMDNTGLTADGSR